MDSFDLNQISLWSDELYGFVLVVMDNMKQPHKYADDETLNMVEAHTLSMIASNPGICISDVAKKWNRTLSAASRNVDRLHVKGYIEKRKEEGNNKTIHLYVTTKGQQLADSHQSYDLEVIQDFFHYITQKYSMEELQQFNCIMKDIQAFYEPTNKS